MKGLYRLLLLITCAGLTGFGQTVEHPRGPGMPHPAAATAAQGVSGVLPASSLGDVLGVRIDAVARAAEKTVAEVRTAPRRIPAEAGEPSEWMRLLCGLAIVAFVARRRTQPPAD